MNALNPSFAQARPVRNTTQEVRSMSTIAPQRLRQHFFDQIPNVVLA